jgi:nucleotide-binding universal stress UspA family protein
MKMLLCTIGSKRRQVTLEFGAQVAKALAADVSLLGVTDREEKLAELSEFLEKAAADLAESGVPARVQVLRGDAEAVVLEEMKRTLYDMVVLGALAGKRSRRRFLNSVGMHIIERATTSVLLVKGERTRLSKVLICASGTEYGHLSIWAGAALACAAGAKATVLHVTEAMPAMYVGLEQMEETVAELMQSDSAMARELRWAAQVVKAECEIAEFKLRRGIVPDEIVEEATAGDYDLVVMGSPRSAGSLVRAMLGDIPREVVTRVQCPVLVMRPIR